MESHMLNYHKHKIDDEISAPNKNVQAIDKKKSSGRRKNGNNSKRRRPAKKSRSKKRKNSKQLPAVPSSLLKTEGGDCQTTAASTATSADPQRQNSSQSNHQFLRPDVPPSGHQSAVDSNLDFSDWSMAGCHLVGVRTSGSAAVVGDRDLGGGYVYADEQNWRS